MCWVKEMVNVDPFPFTVGKVRLAHPGWLNGKYTTFDPRPEYDKVTWHSA
jgi:hypothetical protein